MQAKLGLDPLTQIPFAGAVPHDLHVVSVVMVQAEKVVPGAQSTLGLQEVHVPLLSKSELKSTVSVQVSHTLSTPIEQSEIIC